MSKLRVGEILIEDDQVLIAGQHLAGRRVSVPADRAPPGWSVALLAWLRRLPVPARLIGWSGAGFAIAGFMLAMWRSAWSDPLGAIVGGGLLVPLGAALMGAAVLKRLVERDVVDINRIAIGARAEPLLGKLRGLIASPAQHQTLEWVQNQMNLPEETTVRLLAMLRDRGELSEEFDADNGEYYYRAIRPDPLDLDARLSTMNRWRKP